MNMKPKPQTTRPGRGEITGGLYLQLAGNRGAGQLVKTGGRLIKHARYYWLLLAESHLTRRLFVGMLRKIAVLPSPGG
jgi:hypothetical protein